MAIVVLAIVIFLFDNLREKRSVPLTKEPGIACFKNSFGTTVENRWHSVKNYNYQYPQTMLILLIQCLGLYVKCMTLLLVCLDYFPS